MNKKLAQNTFKNPKNPKRVLVFGKNGTISSKLRQIIGKSELNIKFISSKNINLCDSKSSKKLQKLIVKNDVIIFISAIAPAKTYSDYLNNISMATNFCTYVEENKVSQFIYMSSDAVYSDNKKTLTESSFKDPKNIHGMMHVSRENIFKNKFLNKLLIIRPTLVYGETDTHNGYGPNLFIRSIKNNKKIKIFGKGEELRDHLYIDDLISVIILSIRFKTIGIINVSSGKLISFYNILKLILKLKPNSNQNIEYIKRVTPMPHNGYRPISNRLVKSLYNIKFNSVSKMLPLIYKKY